MKDGFLLIDKKVGPTSHDVIRDVRHRLSVKRVGHAGTLDPFASGLLIVLVNRATRMFDYLTDFTKTYEGVIRLGEKTDTDDRTGLIIATSDTWHDITESRIGTTMQSMVGEQLQTPPIYSAKKVGGRPAHRRVRRGEHIELTPKAVTVSSFEPIARSGADIGFRVRVSTGTYIRALARDLGEALGCGAHLAELRRTTIGPFDVTSARNASDVSWHDVEPADRLVQHLEKVVVHAADRDALCHGQKISYATSARGVVTVFADQELVAIAEARDDGRLHPRLVLQASND